MSKELVIGSNRHETKVAVLEDDQLVEVYFQRANEYSLAGSIHKGRVTRVLPGMQSAFVDLGLERDTFLYVSDFFEEHDDIDTVAEEKPARVDRRENNGYRGGTPEQRNLPEAPQLRIPEEPRRAATQAPIEPPATSDPAETEKAPLSAIPTGDIAAAEGQGPDGGGDRGSHGDRRGRRSRRRRQRGGGFPENKYAQASGPTARTAPEAVRAVKADEQAEEPSDVVLLPGESLAKYKRNVSAPSAAPAGSNRQEPAEPETQYGDAGAESEGGGDEAVSEEDLLKEAQEIALADLVFSHREDPSVQAVEESIAGVEESVPVESATEETDVRLADVGPGIGFFSRGPEPETVDPQPREAAELEPLTPAQESEPSDAPLPARGPIELDEFEVLAIQEGMSGEDEPALDELAADEPSGAISETDSVAPESAEGQPQTASLREQGGRSMHRVSRRMRRRRGGSRFGQQSRETSSEASTVEPIIATGAAAAVAPELRTEMHRERVEDKAVEKAERVYPSISDLLKPGQEIIVQIAKEPLGQKGARITSHIALPGRFVVFMPSVSHLGVSRKVASDEERQRLKRILQAHRPGTTGGFIVRTAGEGVPEEEIAADMNFLYSLWLDIRQKTEKKPAPALLHCDLDVVQRILRDQVTDEFKAIWVDNEDLYESVLTFMQRFQPALVNRVKMYTRSAPIFDAFNITQELEKALRPKVWLKSGGYIVINQTEALVAIDINTGKYVGKSNRLEDTIVKTNTEAIKEIVRQIRLRDLGGIIVVDFIDMDERKNRQKVMQALEEAMRADKAPYKILQFNDFGLVAITRKRVKQSLERTLCSPCPYCEGAGYVKSVQTVIGEILVEAQKIARAVEGNNVVLRVHPDVAKVLKASDNRFLEEMEETLGRPVLVSGDPALHHQKFDLA